MVLSLFLGGLRLKTPPATPLFPSLEMEANAPEMVVQRELPIIQTLSRVRIQTLFFTELLYAYSLLRCFLS